MGKQLALGLPPRDDFSAARFVNGEANAGARSALARWRDWPGGAMALVGPPGTGKSHLGAMWREESHARLLRGQGIEAALSSSSDAIPILIEDIDRGFDEEGLFHLLNRAVSSQTQAVLLTARTSPARWPVAIPDLKSRLTALPVAELFEPDDDLLRRVLEKLFKDQQSPVADGLIDYLLPRMERSVDAARRLVAALDRDAMARRTPVNRGVARRVLEDWAEEESGKA
tara:strand:+ start:7673 stop:8356 length:684 start_codon:yes stop_codon:yes gene_type:complete